MRPSRKLRDLLLVGSAALIAPPAMAQDITQSWTSSQLLLNSEKEAWAAPECVDPARWTTACPGPRPSTKPGRKAPAPSPQTSAASEAALRFRPSAEQRRRNIANFVARSRSANPAAAAELQAVLTPQLIDTIGAGIAPYGLRTDDLADAAALYITNAWEAANNTTMAPDRSRLQALRRQMVRAMLSTPGLAQASDATKQEMAESMLIQAGMLGSSWEQAVKSGDKKTMAALGEAAHQGARATLGIDLRTLAMTDAGLQAKPASR